MTVVRPFRGIRPAKDKVHLVASRPVDTYSPQQLHDKLSGNPFTFLHIIQPNFGKKIKSRPGSEELLKKIKKKFLKFRKNKIFIRDKQACVYIYRQQTEYRIFTGIIALASVWDYLSNTIRKHEETIAAREEKLKSYLEVCDFNAEPVCLCYPDNPMLEKILHTATAGKVIYDFTTTDKIRHQLWRVNEPVLLKKIIFEFSQIPAVYIADGHHRCASSALLAKTMKEKSTKHTGNEPYNFFMAAFFPASNLAIYEYNRLVKETAGIHQEALFKKLSEYFIVEEKNQSPFKPERKAVFGMYYEKKWYSLSSKEMYNAADAAILTEKILSPIFGITDLRKDKHISFVSGAKGANEIKKQVDAGKAVLGFTLFPVTISDIISAANSGKSMPPKSTWVEPKLRSGLIIFSLSE